MQANISNSKHVLFVNRATDYADHKTWLDVQMNIKSDFARINELMRIIAQPQMQKNGIRNVIKEKYR